MVGCCTTYGCCAQPHGHDKTVQSAQILAVVALIASFFLAPVLFLVGMAAPVLILCTSCTEINKCGLTTAAVFSFVAGIYSVILIVVVAINESQCENASSFYADGQNMCGVDNLNLFLGIINTIIWTLLGLLALKIPPAATEQSMIVSAEDTDEPQLPMAKAVEMT